MNLLVEGQTPSVPAKKSDLDGWIKDLKVPFTVAGDVAEAPFAIKKTLGVRETAYLLDRATMKVLFKGANVYAVQQELDKLP